MYNITPAHALDALRALHGGYSYLSYPPPNSWVWTFAFIFRILGLLCIVPILCLALLDITSYAIVRTLGIPYAHPTSSKRVVLVEPEKASSHISKENSDSSLSVGELPSKPPEYFTTPGEGASLGLAGFGLWSPPATRPSSPVTSRNHSRLAISDNPSLIGTHDKEASDDEGKPQLRQRRHGPEIVVTESTS